MAPTTLQASADRRSDARVCARESTSLERERALARECAYEGATLAVHVPRLAETRAAVGVGHRHRRHRVRNLGQRRIERDLVAAYVILLTERTRLYGSELPGPQ